MNCPNCDKRPVKPFNFLSLNGVKFKDFLRGYFRCKHCGTLLKQAKGPKWGLKSVPRFKKGLGKWIILYMVLLFGLLMSVGFVVVEKLMVIWIAIPVYSVLITGMAVATNVIKIKYWIIEEVDSIEEDQQEKLKQQPRMDALGWTSLLGFIILMLGGGITLTQYIDPSGIPEWLHSVGFVLYLVVIVTGSLQIFNYFSESGDQIAGN